MLKIKRALISVSNKKGLPEFAGGLNKLGVEIVSTGGTAKALRDSGVQVTLISEITGFPEIMQGRVKTLHPKIAGGILGKRDIHAKEAEEQQIPWIDLVVCNLYPFAETIKKPNADLEIALENIDIGGHTILRAAAKNFPWVGVIVDPDDYAKILEELENNGSLSLESRSQLAAKAFAHTAQYDSVIAGYMQKDLFPQNLTLPFEKIAQLRYGENPHQQAAVYQQTGAENTLLTAKQHQGKQLSFNNIFDADAAIACLKEFTKPACVVLKHANPCGVAQNEDINQAFFNAWNADSKSAFGGIVAVNKTCSKEIAEHLAGVFIEILIAPGYEPSALTTLQQKPNIRVLEFDGTAGFENKYHLKYVTGGVLLQTPDDYIINERDLRAVTKKQLTRQEVQDLLFAWKTVKHVKSNAIVIARGQTTLAIGPGQVSRVGAVNIAIGKAGNDLNGAVLASDAFFPFRDNIDKIGKTGIKAIIQPGGSIRDEDVIAACDEYGIAMVFTGIRCFNH